MNRAAASILGRSEFRKLMGKRGGNLLFLMGVFSFSLFAIGATKGVLNFLQERMEDPFVQLVGIEIPREISITTCNEWVFGADCPSLDDGCNPASLARCTGWKEEFGIQDFVSIYQTARLFSATGDTNAVDVGWAANISESSGLYAAVLSRPQNFITRFEDNPLFLEDVKHGLILSLDFAKKIEYNHAEGNGYVWFHMSRSDRGIPLPVAAVVKDLPDEIEILASKNLFNFLLNRSDWSLANHPLHPSTQLSTTFVLVQDTLDDQYPAWKSQAIQIWPSQSHHPEHQLLEFKRRAASIPGPRMPIPENNNFFLKEWRGNPDISFVFFKDLDQVGAYRDTLKNNPSLYTSRKTTKIILDTADVEAKENLSTFESVARTMSWALLVLGVLLIVLYLVALFKNHLETNEQNLGTLQAFGFSNPAIIRLYMLIGLGLILVAFSLSYLLLSAIGTPLLLEILDIAGVSSTTAIEFQHATLWQLCLAFLLLPAVAIGAQIRNKLMGATPGDLIYKRRS